MSPNHNFLKFVNKITLEQISPMGTYKMNIIYSRNADNLWVHDLDHSARKPLSDKLLAALIAVQALTNEYALNAKNQRESDAGARGEI